MSRPPVRGRRPGSQDTGAQILAAARQSFATKGFAGTTIRGVAADAGVDPALVHHYFGSKDDLFLAALEIPVDPREVLPKVLAGGVEGAAARLLPVFLSVWDDPGTRLPLLALIRASMAHEESGGLLQDAMRRLILQPLRAMLPAEEAERRTSLVASQMVGLIMVRYVLRIEPLASMSAEAVVRDIGPTIQRYLDGPLDD